MLAGLLDSLEVKGYKLKNRIVMPPMGTSLATTQGAVTDRLIEHYTRRSEALGLLIRLKLLVVVRLILRP